MIKVSKDICLNNYLFTKDPNMIFTVEGDFIPPVSGTWNNPPEGGYIEDLSIYYKEIDVTELLNELYLQKEDKYISLYDFITQKADEKARKEN